MMKGSVLVVLLCVVGAGSDFNGFWDSVKVQFKHAWIAFKNFIKRPPRSKRLVKKTTEQTKVTEKRKAFETTTVQNLDMLYYFQRTRPNQIFLPIISIPKWKTRSDWRQIQQPDLDVILRNNEYLGSENGRKSWNRGMNRFTSLTERDVTPTRQLDETDEGIGVMMFI